jgi:hypothetical protein
MDQIERPLADARLPPKRDPRTEAAMKSLSTLTLPLCLLLGACVTVVAPPAPAVGPEAEAGAEPAPEGEPDSGGWAAPVPRETPRELKAWETRIPPRARPESRNGRFRNGRWDPDPPRGSCWISLSLASSEIGGSFRYHRDYLEDFDRASLKRAFGLEQGATAQVSARFEPARGPALRAFLRAASFESEPGFEGAPFELRGETRTQTSADPASLGIYTAGLGLDFAVASWPSGRFRLGTNLVWSRAELEADGLKESVQTGMLVGTSDLTWILWPETLFFGFGFDLGLGADGGEAGVRASLAWRPFRTVELRAGFHTFSGFLDDVCEGNAPDLSGNELAFTMRDLFCELSIKCF